MLNRAEVERQQQLLAYEAEVLAQQQAADRERALLLAEAEARARLAALAPPAPVAAPVPPPAAAAAAAPAPVVQTAPAPVDAPVPAAAAPVAPSTSTAEATLAAALEAKKASTAASTPSKAKAKSKAKSAGGGTAKGKSGTTPKKGAAAATKRKAPAGGGGSGPALKGPIHSLEDPVPPISSQDYDNLQALMNQFCRVPLLAEFSRPVSSLHPELIPVYSKVVKHPIDLAKVCRSIRRREYKDTRAVRLDMWRIFANCIKFHCHPSTREGAIPSFVSIALHLRDYFNALWEEHMLPSETPVPPSKPAKAKANPTEAAYYESFKARDERRKKRIVATSSTALSNRTLERVASEIENFTDANGMVDGLDGEPIVSPMTGMESADEVAVKEAYDAVVVALTKLKEKMTELANENEEYTVAELETDLKRCYSTEVFADRQEVRKKLGDRLNRLLGKIVVPIFETNCRGVNQSSVWGCMAACIWARESSKKPYWPALVLGIMAPEDQREDWHNALTERNEGRLPESLRQQLEPGKRKAVAALKRQSTGKAERMSFFLVEFLGTHEFTWCKESDIIEQFDPEEDPDTHVGGPQGLKKKHHTRDHRINPQTERLRQKAVEEGRWALEEFEMQLSDTCGDLYLSDDEDNDELYTYDVLSQSDNEGDTAMQDADGVTADGATSAAAAANDDDAIDGTISDEEEIAELLSTEGMLDYSVAGRKLSKKRVAAIKKAKSERAKALQKKKKAEQDKKKKAEAAKKKKAEPKTTKSKAEIQKLNRERQKQQKELEKRRKKRERDREMMQKKAKKAKLSALENVKKGGRKSRGIPDKQERATALVRGYLTRIAKKDDLGGLGFSSAATLPPNAVESTSLLGMALAFRSAAGYADMPLGKGEEPVKKPWDKIDTEGPSKSEDRCKNLARQAEMLEQELAKIAKENAQRRVLIAQAHRQREEREKEAIRKEERIKKQAGVPKKKSAKKPKEPESGKTTPVPTKAEPAPSAAVDSKTKENDLPVAVAAAASAAVEAPTPIGTDTGASDDVVMAEVHEVEPAVAPAPAPVPSQP